jgi:hypothetical protein
VGDHFEQEREIVTRLSKGFQMVHSTLEVEAEVANGGFNQYFWNSSGRFAAEALAGYKLVGATRHAELVEKAIAIYSRERPKQEQFKRKGTVQAFSESYEHTALNALDDPFYALDKTEKISPLRIKYIRDHPAEFVGD